MATVALLIAATTASLALTKASVRFTADLVGAAAGVAGSGAPVLTVGGPKLITGEGRAARVVLYSVTCLTDGDVDIGTAADSSIIEVCPAASVARAWVLAGLTLAGILAAVLTVVVATNGYKMTLSACV